MKNLRAMYSAKKYSANFKGYICKLLKDCAYAPTPAKFEIAKARLIQKGLNKARQFLDGLSLDKWAVAFAPNVHRYGELTSNAAESFNSWILGPRSLPVTYMLDSIRQQLMRWFNERRESPATWTGALTPIMESRWNQAAAIGEGWTILPTNQHGCFEVLSETSVVVSNTNFGIYKYIAQNRAPHFI